MARSSSPGSLCSPRPVRASSREEPASHRRRLLLRPPRLSAPQPPPGQSRPPLPALRPRRPPRWPGGRPPHLRVRRHPAGAHSGTASGALPGHYGAHAARRGLAPPGGRAVAGRELQPRVAGSPQLASGQSPAAPASLGDPGTSPDTPIGRFLQATECCFLGSRNEPKELVSGPGGTGEGCRDALELLRGSPGSLSYRPLGTRVRKSFVALEND